MQLPLHVVDAFTDRPFAGNPAAVCPLEVWLPDETMQAIAAENNLSETAFLVPDEPDEKGYELRWFTPRVEVDLCGHATLAAAAVVFEHLRPGTDAVSFRTRCAGPLSVARRGSWLELDFPTRAPEPCEAPVALLEALDREPNEVLRSERDYLVVFESREEVLALAPRMPSLLALGLAGIIVTAPGTGEDFVSRFFAPAFGIDEDPVTGSAHCVLIPYWAERLGRRELTARQVSRRGGTLRCTLRGPRVGIAGQVAPYLQGTITVPR